MGERTVCIVGMAPSSHLAIHEPLDVEMWGMTQGHAVFPVEFVNRFTAWFEIHGWELMEMVQNPELGHLDFLKTTHLPVYLDELNPEGCPTGIRYPYEEVCQFIGGAYLTSSAAYMLALAIYQGFDMIKIYGVDMTNAKEYEEQRSCFEFLIGLALGRGQKVWLPPGCPLLKGPLYAKTVHVTTTVIRGRMLEWIAARDNALAEFHRLEGRVKAGQELLNLALKGKDGQGAAQIDLSQGDDGLLSLVAADRVLQVPSRLQDPINEPEEVPVEIANTPPVLDFAEDLINAYNNRSP